MLWVSERNDQLKEAYRNGDFRTRDHFLELLTQAESNSPGLIASLADELKAPDKESIGINYLQDIVQIRTKLPFDVDMLLTAACAWDLGRSPQLETWLKVRKIARHSWEIENWLSSAMSAHAQNDAGAKKAYIDLATQLFKALEQGNLRSESDRRNEERESEWSHWELAKYPLEEIWWGLRGSDFMRYEEEMRIFGLLSEIAPTDFIQLIAGSNNPFLVNAALLSAGVGAFSPRFAQWEAITKAAPLAFDSEGSWTGSVLLPLLLVHARSELHAPSRQTPRYGADEAEVSALTAQVVELVYAVVDIIASREDAPAAFARWSTWLMRQMLLQHDQEFNDIRSHGFVDNTLLDAMGKAMLERSQIHAAPKDAAPWEVWCYFCVRSSFAHDGLIKKPSFEEFASQWQLTPENWYEPEGRGLLERANLHLLSDEIPGLSANLLVLPLASNGGFASGWQQLWNRAYYLREVLEFGSVDAVTSNYSDRADASRLLLLLGCMGLACFDQVTTRIKESTEQPTDELASLHRMLTLATMEVLHVDNTLNHDKWKTLLQHLAVRRMYLDSRYTAENRITLFTDHHKPSIRDYLSYFQADPSDLLAFLHACMLNRLDIPTLRDELQDCGVDLCACVNMLKRLHELHGHRYPMPGGAIRAIGPLMN